MKVGIVAVGTELTDGEIVNRNGAWLAKQLQQLGFTNSLHMTLPDEREAMLEGLRYTFTQSDVVFIGGGLGPTSDDITRVVISQFVDDPLVFQDSVYQQLVETYETRGLPLREAHKHQCYFPSKAQLLLNPVGTALGFISNYQGKKIFVLPGPPREFEGMFEEQCLPHLRAIKPPKREELYVWKTLGVPESEVAEVVEPIVKKCNARVGYRASVPYVIVKVWVPVSGKNCAPDVEKALEKWTVARGEEDLAKKLVEKLTEFSSVRLMDSVTGGKLAGRLQTFVDKDRKPTLEINTRFFDSSGDEYMEDVQANFSLRFEDEGVRIAADVDGRAYSEKIILPYRIAARSERGRISVTEQAIWRWVKFLG